MTPIATTLLNDAKKEFLDRKFSVGLMIALLDMFEKIGVSNLKVNSLSELFEIYPKVSVRNGKKRNTLILETNAAKPISLRPFYNAVEIDIRSTHSRMDYPSCAPHATQAWADYVKWCDLLCQLAESEYAPLRQALMKFVLDAYPSQAFDPASVSIRVPVFSRLLRDFSFTASPNEPTGAAFQGAVFGLIRADNPHLQVEIGKVRVGSKRLQRVGDIDAWNGNSLRISAEVKAFKVTSASIDSFIPFCTTISQRQAIGMIVAIGFDDGVASSLDRLGVRALDLEALIDIVSLWDYTVIGRFKTSH